MKESSRDRKDIPDSEARIAVTPGTLPITDGSTLRRTARRSAPIPLPRDTSDAALHKPETGGSFDDHRADNETSEKIESIENNLPAQLQIQTHHRRRPSW